MGIKSLPYGGLKSQNPQAYAALSAIDRELHRNCVVTQSTPDVLTEVELSVLEAIDAGDAFESYLHSKFCGGTYQSNVVQRLVEAMRTGHFPAELMTRIKRWHRDLVRPLEEIGTPRFVARDLAKANVDARGKPVMQVTPRRFESVVDALRLDPGTLESLRGENVLSIGEGASNFAMTLETRYGARAVALDPVYRLTPLQLNQLRIASAYANSPVARMTQPSEVARDLPSFKVAGRGQELPFRDETFFAVFISYVLPWYFGRLREQIDITDNDEGLKLMDEAWRVCRSGGAVIGNCMSPVMALRLVELLKDRYPAARVRRESDLVFVGKPLRGSLT